MVLSKTLLENLLEEYETKKNLNFVVSKSLPILFFGDLESFSTQKKKVVTVGLNPSNIEFQSNPNEEYSFFRFPEYDRTIESLELTLNNYFKHNPYTKWFKTGYEPLLNGLGGSFFPDNDFDKVLHTDICSPLSTNPTWSKLNFNEQESLRRDGFELWKSLIHELKPHLIILSTRRGYLQLLSPKYIKTIHTINTTKEGKPRRPFNLDLFEVNINGFQTYLVYGEPKNIPFGSVTTEDKILMGKFLSKYTTMDKTKTNLY